MNRILSKNNIRHVSRVAHLERHHKIEVNGVKQGALSCVAHHAGSIGKSHS